MQEITNDVLPFEIPLVGEKEAFDEKGVKAHLWNRDEYYRLAELGFFQGKRVELIEGEIFEMLPMNKSHATAIRLLLDVFRKIFGDGFWIDSQLPMSFSSRTEPEPDIAVLKGKISDFAESHPQTAALVVEVSDTTLWHDRNRKSSLYAKNGIQDYWILNLRQKRLEIYRRPIEDENAFYGFSYAEIMIFTGEDAVSPIAKPDAKIKVADLLP